jgi:hypothetical protein
MAASSAPVVREAFFIVPMEVRSTRTIELRGLNRIRGLLIGGGKIDTLLIGDDDNGSTDDE